MISNIPQHVVPRKRSGISFSHFQVPGGVWQTRQVRPVRRWWQLGRRGGAASVRAQHGSVTQSTLTLGVAVLALAVVSLLGFFYLQQVFGTAAQGSDIQKLEASLVELKEQQRALELEGADVRSLQSVQQRVRELNLVDVDRVAYLAPMPGHVARLSR